jgi:hypothetical protein
MRVSPTGPREARPDGRLRRNLPPAGGPTIKVERTQITDAGRMALEG